ncbi:hypothetical protein D9M71_690040 [compost metagenome]
MEIVSFGRQRDAVRMAVEQAHAQLGLQRQHRVGDGGLRDMFIGGGHREPARAGGGREVAQLAQRDVF